MPRLSKIGAAALAAFGWTGISSVSASYLVVAGGGGSGGADGGGGGAGGLLTGTASLNPTLTYTVTVGAGGAAGATSASTGSNGSNSVFSSITSTGGGGATGYGVGNGIAGGSGGGAGGGGTYTGGAGTSGQGYAGGATYGASTPYSGGGGGGSAGVGQTGRALGGGDGGIATASSISGTSTYYAGGGGGGAAYLSGTTTAGLGGGTATTANKGGGGDGSVSSSSFTGNGIAGTANTGGGGGGGSGSGSINLGGAGGSGIVIISYAGAQQFSGGVVTSSGGNTIHTFTTSGTLGPVTPLSANYLVVAGGGSGGGGYFAGGGGAGGLLSGSSLTIDPYSTYVVTVGSGAAAVSGNSVNGLQGSNSAFSMVSTAAVGGGYGAGYGGSGVVGGVGGSGGGTAANALATVAAGTSGQGNAGGQSSNNGGGGGGGAGSVGGNAGASFGTGGTGSASSISGTSTTYAAGGAGGIAGVGNGASGTANTGNGGAASSASGGTSGAGGSGVVIISYAGSTQLMAGGVVTIAGGNVIHTFNSSGYLSPLTLFTNSLRFRSSASAYLTRTPATATNRKTFTWSGWVKRGTLSTYQNLFSATTGGYPFILRFDNDNTIFVYQDGTSDYGGSTSAVYRDPSAWYHIVLAMDTTQATDTNRLKLYVNGVQNSVSAFYGYFALNVDTSINSTGVHAIGQSGSANYFDGYMAEVNFIDGQALAPTAFGTTNSYGVWQPITYGGSYGTNGFRLPFTNNASTTTLGYDFSPQGNNWTTNNISVTAGATYDSMTDVPTLTSATAANFAVLNPLYPSSTPVGGNLNVVGDSNSRTVAGTMSSTTGKYYAEGTFTSGFATNGWFYVWDTSTPYVPGNTPGTTAQTGAYYAGITGNIFKNIAGTATTIGTYSTWTNNDIIGMAFDADAGTISFYKNNTLQVTITDSAFIGRPFTFGIYYYAGSASMNFGQRPFTYTPPSGYVALNTFNL